MKNLNSPEKDGNIINFLINAHILENFVSQVKDVLDN
jgi:hypothetical protein